MNFNYLIDASNLMASNIKYLNGEDRIAPDSLRMYLKVGCDNLSKLLKDQEFIDLMQKGVNEFESNRDLIINEIEDIDQFISGFKKIEMGILLESGMQRKMAQFMLRDANKIQDIININLSEEIERLPQRMEELCYAVCSEANRFDDIELGSSLFRRAVKFFGGSTIVAANMATDVITWGTVSYLSCGYGGHLVIESVKKKGNG